jgi:hypothetical protein
MLCPEKPYQACGCKSRLGKRAGAPSKRPYPSAVVGQRPWL